MQAAAGGGAEASGGEQAAQGRKRASREEGAAEQQPHGGSGCHWEGRRPQRAAAGSGGVVLYRRGHYRKDRLVEVACRGRQTGWTDPPHHGI